MDVKKKVKGNTSSGLENKVQQTEASSSNASNPPHDTDASRREFTALDFEILARNEHYRYPPNSKKVGHAVITEEDGLTIAQQYKLPKTKNQEDAPRVRPLVGIKKYQPFPGMERFQAHTPNGTRMFGKRSTKGKRNKADGTEESFETVCFSPSSREGARPFFGSNKKTPLLKETVSSELQEALAEIKPRFKGGHALTVEPGSVTKRLSIEKRTPDQNEVMGESARDAYEHFFDEKADVLHPKMQELLKRAFLANMHGPDKNHRPEWLHLYAHSLTPMDQDPQKKENLGAAPKWANTQMMILERTVQWFALNVPDSLSTIISKFKMLLDSELTKHIDFSAKIRIKENYVKLMQDIDPLLKYPLFPKASDLAQIAAVTDKMLRKIPSVSTEVVQMGTSKPKSAFHRIGGMGPRRRQDHEVGHDKPKLPNKNKRQTEDNGDYNSVVPQKRQKIPPKSRHESYNLRSKRHGLFERNTNDTEKKHPQNLEAHYEYKN